VDFVLPPEGIAKELARIGRHPYLIQTLATEVDELLAAGEDEINQILSLVRSTTGDDFTYYKKTTIKRRIKRRMVLQKMEKLAQYVRYLRGNNQELQDLYQDFLINVTGFFRDPGVYLCLKKRVLPVLLKNRPTDSAIQDMGTRVFNRGRGLLDCDLRPRVFGGSQEQYPHPDFRHGHQ
jgi:two-component system CheB/CheR fusion protein